MTDDAYEMLHQKGYRHHLRGEWKTARSYYEQALRLNPGYAFSLLALAHLDMLQSDFREGRDRYEIRFATNLDSDLFDLRGLPTPRWQGEPLKGKHLYLWAEQGIGSVVMYATFMPYLLAQQPSRITFGMLPKMMSLFARSFPQAHIESLQDALDNSVSQQLLEVFPQLLELTQMSGVEADLEPLRKDYERARTRGMFDYSAPMGDTIVYCLPHYIPAESTMPILKPDPARVAAMKAKLATLGQGRLAGISWQTSNEKSLGVRNIPLAEWKPVLDTPGCHFISLQHHVSLLEIECFNAENGCRIIADPELDIVRDIEGLAALIACMDEVITVDNSNAHMAGGLGVPTTLLLPKGCDFRWPMLGNGTDTLWYQCVKVQRQEEAMDWSPVIARTAAALRRRAGS